MKRPNTLTRVQYNVTGSGWFPMDMLRYDHSFPVGADDEAALLKMRTHRVHRTTVTLETYLPPYYRAKSCPSRQRWRSFGWLVSPRISMERVRIEEVPFDRLPLNLRR